MSATIIMFNDKKKLEEFMKMMNVREVSAKEVVIKRDGGKDIFISNPHIVIANVGGHEVYQISGNVSEKSSVSEKDISIVMEKTGKTREEVVRKLEELDNDLATAIIELKEAENL